MTADDLYPNSPLREVVFEIRFPGEPAVECHRDQFFELVRKEFPQVLVPHIKPGQAVALAPYHFQTEDGRASLMTAMNLFAYRTSNYPGFASFQTQALRWMRAFGEVFRLDHLNRTGLRYINAIPYGSPDVPINRFFKVGINFGSIVPEQFSQFLLIAEIPAGIGSLRLQLGAAEQSGEDVLVLDFDFWTGGDLHFAEIERYLEASHTETKRLFEGLPTDEYRTYLKGEALK